MCGGRGKARVTSRVRRLGDKSGYPGGWGVAIFAEGPRADIATALAETSKLVEWLKTQP